jgi:hypothetical protein
MKTILKLSLVFTALFIIACSSNDDSPACTEQTWYQDSDGDTFGNLSVTLNACTQPIGYVLDNTDFNDNDATTFPNAVEICDGFDNDGDGQTDGLTTSNCGVGEVCENGSCVTAVTYYFDADGDGYGDGSNSIVAGSTAPTGYVADSSDCDDDDVTVNPGATEIQDNMDNNCDGLVDECSSDADCTGVCIGGTCYILCVSDSDCPAGTTCVDLGGGVKVCQ